MHRAEDLPHFELVARRPVGQPRRRAAAVLLLVSLSCCVAYYCAAPRRRAELVGRSPMLVIRDLASEFSLEAVADRHPFDFCAKEELSSREVWTHGPAPFIAIFFTRP
jgi:hypothetical protein